MRKSTDYQKRTWIRDYLKTAIKAGELRHLPRPLSRDEIDVMAMAAIDDGLYSRTTRLRGAVRGISRFLGK